MHRNPGNCRHTQRAQLTLQQLDYVYRVSEDDHLEQKRFSRGRSARFSIVIEDLTHFMSLEIIKFSIKEKAVVKSLERALEFQ